MKLSKLFLLIVSIVFLTQALVAQKPYIPKFKQADPIWKITLVNELFVNHPDVSIHQNPYTCVTTQLTTELLVDSFLISVVPTSSDWRFLDALIVQKINMNTGEVLWKDIIYDANIDSIGWVSYPKIIYKRKDGNIEFCGNRKIIYDKLQIFDYSYRAVYDFETGHRTLFYDKTNSAVYPDKYSSTNGEYKMLVEDSLYLKTYVYFEGGDEPVRGLNFCLVNAQHDSIQYIKTIITDPQMPVNRFTFRTACASAVNDSIYAVLWNLEGPQQNISAGKNMLYLFNYKDINNIHLVKTIDITEYIRYDWRSGPTGLSMDIYDGKIHVYDQFYDYDEQKVLNNSLVMDDHGNVIDHIDIIKDTDNQYYSKYIPFYITDTLKLFWAYGSKYSDIEISYDIVKMNDDKEMEYVASLFPAGNQGAYFAPNKTLLLDNKLIIFGHYKLPDVNDSLTYYILAFDMDELIKGSTTVYTTDPIDIGDQVVVYPNPTMDKLYIKGVDDIINIDVFDNQGRGYPVNSGNYDVIDMESYPSGIYYIKIETTDSYKTLKVIKQ